MDLVAILELSIQNNMTHSSQERMAQSQGQTICSDGKQVSVNLRRLKS